MSVYCKKPFLDGGLQGTRYKDKYLERNLKIYWFSEVAEVSFPIMSMTLPDTGSRLVLQYQE